MLIRKCFYAAAAMILLGMPSAQAVTYQYVGNPLMEVSGRLTAVVELNCSAPCAAGTYFEGSGLTSFTVTAYSGLWL
jgi:hypothetical protein